MALRFSGRLSVTVATLDSIASWTVVYAIPEGATMNRINTINDSNNSVAKTLRTWFRSRPWPAAARQAVSERATSLHGQSAPRQLFRSECYPPAHLGRTGNRQVHRAPSRSVGSLRRRQRPLSLPPDRA